MISAHTKKYYIGKNLNIVLELLLAGKKSTLWRDEASETDEAAAGFIWEDIGGGSPYIFDKDEINKPKPPGMPYATTLMVKNGKVSYICRTEQIIELDDIAE